MSKVTIRSKEEYPKVTKRIELKDYHPDLEGDYVDVWVNIDRELEQGLLDGKLESLHIATLPASTDDDMAERRKRLAQLVDDMKSLHERWWDLEREVLDFIYDTDVELYHWIVGMANHLKDEYEEERKNAVRELSDS